MTPEEILVKHLSISVNSPYTPGQDLMKPYRDAMNEYAAQQAQPLLNALKHIQDGYADFPDFTAQQALNDYKENNKTS